MKTIFTPKKTLMAILIASFALFNLNFLHAQSNALYFDGNNSYIEANSVSDALGGTPQMSMEAWINRSDNETESKFFLTFHQSVTAVNSHENILLVGTSNTGKFVVSFHHNSIDNDYRGTTTIEKNTWTHVAITIGSDNTAKFYINGEFEAMTKFSDGTSPLTSIPVRPVSGGTFSIAQDWDGTAVTNDYIGQIDEIRIWNTVRTQDEVRDNRYNQLTGTEAGLVAYYKMTDGSGTSLTDNSSNSNTGTLHSNVSWENDFYIPVGDGSTGTPYEIATLENLHWLSQTPSVWSSNFIQTADIDAALTSTWDGGAGFMPVGTDHTNYFSGTYNGEGHIIHSLYIDRTKRYVGLFGYIKNSTIQNLGLTNTNITTNQSQVGSLLGYGPNCTILNCYSTGQVSGTSEVGGLVGSVASGSITNCHSGCSVQGSISNIGGLIGSSDGTLSGCYANGTVTGGDNANSIGGLAGRGANNVINCYATGSSVGGSLSSKIGGLIGEIYTYYRDLSVLNSYSIGAVAGGSDVGGLIGKITAQSMMPGEPTPIVSIVSSFWDTETSTQSLSASGEGKTTLEMKALDTYISAGWDFTEETTNGLNDVWKIDWSGSSNDGYPFLSWQDLTVSKQSQTITFNELSDKTYGDEEFDLIASASSELSVSYVSSNTDVVTISGNTVTIVGAGTTVITAFQVGNMSYNAATSVDQDLKISKAELIVAADNNAKTYGEANPALTVSYSGFVNSEDSTVLTTLPTAACTATASTGAGSATISASGGVADNYSFKYVDGTLTISQAELSVTADDKAKTYGEANPALTVSYSGFVNSEDSTVLTTLPTAACSADETTGVGSASITASGGVAGNYSFKYVDGTLTISQAELSVTADDKAKTYGEANPALTVSYSGFVNSEDSTVLSTLPTAACSADETTGVGSASITASGGVADNYSFKYVDGTLTISQAELSVTADDKAKTYGEANPALTVSYSGFVNSEDSTVLTTLPTAACSADETTGVGSASITASGGVADNYSFKYVDGALTIGKATATVTLGSLSATYDGDSKAASATTSPADLSVEFTYDGEATAPTNAGTYAVVATIDDANHEGSVNGNLVIAKADQAITVDSIPAKMVGDEDFLPTVSASSGLEVAFSSSDVNVATIVDGKVRITGGGTCMIYANQSGDDNYNAAPQAVRYVIVEVATFQLEQSILDVAVFPSINNGRFSVKLNNARPFTTVVYDLNGKAIMNRTNCAGLSEFNLSAHNPGCYIVKVFQDETVISKRVIIQ